MLKIRRNEDIYKSEGGWYTARWHFSFDKYHDPEFMGVGPLRVFNDDYLIPGAVWPMHPHKDIEGITYVVEGLFEHADSLGNGGQLDPGAVQRATLGWGMQHSERNGSQEHPMRFLQFWILPDKANLKPSIEQRQYTKEDRAGKLLEVLNPEGDGALKVHQDARVYVSSLEPGQVVEHPMGARRGLYVYLIDGRAAFNDQEVRTGDAAIVTDEHSLRIEATDAESELILIDVPLDWEPVGVWAQR